MKDVQIDFATTVLEDLEYNDKERLGLRLKGFFFFFCYCFYKIEKFGIVYMY